MDDANRRGTCLAVARQLASRGETLLFAQRGAAMESRLTGDDAARRRFAPLLEVGRREGLSVGEGCEGLHRIVRRLEREAEIGERASLMERVPSRRRPHRRGIGARRPMPAPRAIRPSPSP